MKTRIENLLKNEVKTTFEYSEEKVNDGRIVHLFRLTGHGMGVGIMIVYDLTNRGTLYTKLIYPIEEMFDINIEQESTLFDKIFVESVKMMVNINGQPWKGEQNGK